MSKREERLRDLIAAAMRDDPARFATLSAMRRWLDWSGRDLDLARPPSRQDARAFLLALRGTEPRTSADAMFGYFQLGAARIWGAEQTAHLAAALRDVRVAPKAAVRSHRDKAARAVSRLPDPGWRAAFDALLAQHGAPGRRGRSAPDWSLSHIESVAAALGRWHRHATASGIDLRPACVALDAYGERLAADGCSATTAATYMERVLSGWMTVIAPGDDLSHVRIVVDRWRDRAAHEPKRRGKASRIVPASRIQSLGYALIDKARAAPMHGLHAARTYRNGLMLVVATCLPERARALRALTFDETLTLAAPDEVRIALPGHALKLREKKKSRGGYETVIGNRGLHDALAEYRRTFRPVFDDGAWLFPSTLDRAAPLSENRIGAVCGDVTERALGVRVNVHLLRDCVVTEAIDAMENGGVLASPLLRHRDPRTTRRHYDHAASLEAARDLARALDRRRSSRPELAL